MQNTIVHSGIFGLCIGDALGVPAEFTSRNILSQNPISEMVGYGTHNQPRGTWSDDSSMTLCLAESLCNGYSLTDISNRFLRWYTDGYMTPHGVVFDIGNTTARSIRRLKDGIEPTRSGSQSERENGNGSLMRILPLAYFLEASKISRQESIKYISEVSGVTHAHPHSVLSCCIYIDLIRNLLDMAKPNFLNSYQKLQNEADYYYHTFPTVDRNLFSRIFSGCLITTDSSQIQSSGYVIHSLEASIWCMLHSSSYQEAVLKAVNLGDDTDTTGAIVGGIAGICYGPESIPEHWIDTLVKKDEIEKLCDRLHSTFYL
jgi:ADP-ribosyl-[dinitrogen reductase] hydrolase